MGAKPGITVAEEDQSVIQIALEREQKAKLEEQLA